ncbi:carbohydrate ABC transporter permease [Inquilinus sp. Marseille-Q2685]|uniref:carbohydrate ABC transporter permease n=1 Tax=Inquilinus sp. Marseille-Q2685 TaxID=2866581 RepID=UPI001CE452C6|nr:carbohydrate ABC transporter permease [Inquilinus sp. Marseille-Q2685]
MGAKSLRGSLVALVLLFFLFPPLWIVASSLKPPMEIFAWPPTLLPQHWTLDNFASALGAARFDLFFTNSAVVAVGSSVLSVVISIMAGFALSKYRFPGDGLCFMLIMATMMIPLQVVLIPMFMVLKGLGLLDSLWGLIIPPAATPTGVFLMRQYMRGIPDSLLEAARIDGTSEWRILWRIVVPLCKPAIATLAAFTFVWRWNDYLWPFLVVNDQSRWTVQLALANYVGQWDIDWPRLLAMAVLSSLPILVLFIALQRFFMSGMMAGATKE